jgi:hypothetical protein
MIRETMRRSERLAEIEKRRSPEMIQTGRAVRPGGEEGASAIHSAFCKNDAGSGSTIVCYLDTDSTGDEITVYCSICRGIALNAAFPYLMDGDRIFVFNDGTYWRALQIFQGWEAC